MEINIIDNDNKYLMHSETSVSISNEHNSCMYRQDEMNSEILEMSQFLEKNLLYTPTKNRVRCNPVSLPGGL